MDSGHRPADYVLFYAKVRSFLEDGCCTLKHTSRRLFQQLAMARGLTIDKHSIDLPPPADADSSVVGAEAESNGSTQRRRRHSSRGGASGRRKPPYRTFYWGFRASTRALLEEAEFLQMELPLKNWDGGPLTVPEELQTACCASCHTSPQDAVDSAMDGADPLGGKQHDFVSAPFVYSKKHLFYGGSKDDGGDAGEFPLTGAQRIYLTHSMLSRIDIRKELRRVLGPHPGTKLCGMDCIYCRCLKPRIIENTPIVLEHLLDAKIFADSFAVHDVTDPSVIGGGGCCCLPCCRRGRDEASVRPEVCESPPSPPPPPLTKVDADIDDKSPSMSPSKRRAGRDLRRRLHETWHCCCRVQPLHLIRLYFGEKLAFYYAWLGFGISAMFSLTGVGLGFLIYGLINACSGYKSETDKFIVQLNNTGVTPTHGNAFSIFLIELMQFMKLMFDNQLTVPFGCVLTLWNLLTTEIWKRYEASLSHRWDVRNHQLAEKRRPEFTARKKLHSKRCCSRQNEWRRCFAVFTVVVFFLAAAVAVAVAYQVPKLQVASSGFCSSSYSHAACLFLSVILPIIGHLIVIEILDCVYGCVAKCLTDCERHEFGSDYEFSYAVKAFAFRFANNYTALFYVAFVRQQDAILGAHTDRCSMNELNVDCFKLLSVYVAGYIVGKALLRGLIDCFASCSSGDRLLACLRAPARRLLCTCCANFKRAAYAAELDVVTALEERQLAADEGSDKGPSAAVLHLVRERHLDKRMSPCNMMDQYLDRVILHGFVVLFGSACYVTPVASLIAMAMHLRLSAGRLLHSHRRPVPHPAGGVGVWKRLHSFLAHVGVFTTGGILAFNSNSLEVFGHATSTSNRLALFTAFSGAMFILKFLMAACISGGSNRQKMRIKWEYFHVPRVLQADALPENDVLDSLEEMQLSGRWYHVLLPCFASGDSSRQKTGMSTV